MFTWNIINNFAFSKSSLYNLFEQKQILTTNYWHVAFLKKWLQIIIFTFHDFSFITTLSF